MSRKGFDEEVGLTLLKMLGRVIFWRYPRGSWQYDILCGFILLFIFLTPRAVFDGRAFVQKDVPEPAPQEDAEPADEDRSEVLQSAK